LAVRRIDSEQHAAFVRTRPWVSFLQTSSWAPMRLGWPRESIGWFAAGEPEPVGVATVLRRPVPGLRRLYLAYLPEGPAIDWGTSRLDEWLEPLVGFLRSTGAFGVRIGPPVTVRRWAADVLKTGLANPDVTTVLDLPPSSVEPLGARVVEHLERSGWRSVAVTRGWGEGQPQLNFQVPLVRNGPDGSGRPATEDELLRAMNQQWRRSIKKAQSAGVEVSAMAATTPSEILAPELLRFHDLYQHTAERDGFEAHEVDYFQRMFAALRDEDPDRITLYLARHEDEVVAASILVNVGTHTWYTYGASSSTKREVYGSTALQWAMLRRSLQLGAEVYDLRGVTSALDSEGGGLIRFKAGTGGELVELAGEWDLPLVRPLYAAFRAYTRPR
jgi:lipid II:glycine glycyltransferase (peptidoglycan interpeptide bridge formation enzyme)